MNLWYRKHEQEITITLFLSLLLSFLVCLVFAEVAKKGPAGPAWWDIPVVTDKGEKIKQVH